MQSNFSALIFLIIASRSQLAIAQDAASASLSLPLGVYFTDTPPACPDGCGCLVVTRSWVMGQTTLLPEQSKATPATTGPETIATKNLTITSDGPLQDDIDVFGTKKLLDQAAEAIVRWISNWVTAEDVRDKEEEEDSDEKQVEL